MQSDGNTADRLTAVALFLLGLAMTWGGFEMDRLEIRRIHPASIPGLVPIFLGAILMICAVLLALGTARSAAAAENPEPAETGNWADFAFAAVWSCLFAIFMVGNMPFVVATAIYIAVFSAWFLWPQQSETSRFKMLAMVALYAILAAAGISALFQYGFLVRLP
jgi:putative tricarboxylic transport membrane protein